MSDPDRTPVLLAGCLGGLLLGGFIGSGCTPGSPSSSPSPDTEASAASPSAPAEMSSSDANSSDASGGSPDAPDRTEGSRTVAQRLEDAGVAARVKQALVRTQSLHPFNFAPAVVRGHLTLRGNVETREQYRTAERVASSVEGVTGVTNQVTIQGRALSETGDPAEVTYHTVRRGDTLWKISREYDVSVRQVRALNDLSESLQPGRRIRVR